MKNIDFIGDIHGYATKLISLLEKLGYQKVNGVYSHPENRKVIFLGDYVDRGPEIFQTIEIVKSMCDTGNAFALMGNHEYNLLSFFTKDNQGHYIRKHSINKIFQVLETLTEFKSKKSEFEQYFKWFLQLPLFIENEYFRAVHASWNNQSIDILKQNLSNNCLATTENLIKSSQTSDFHYALNATLKGIEIPLPKGESVILGDYIKRKTIRLRWWEEKFEKLNYREIEANKMDVVPDIPVPSKYDIQKFLYPKTNKPVFFGHYWLKGEPKILRKNMCCLDYSIAKGHKLAAYRFDGEQFLSNNKLVWVE